MHVFPKKVDDFFSRRLQKTVLKLLNEAANFPHAAKNALKSAHGALGVHLQIFPVNYA